MHLPVRATRGQHDSSEPVLPVQLIIWYTESRSQWQQVDGHTFESKAEVLGRRHRCSLSALWHLSVKVFQIMTEVGKRSCEINRSQAIVILLQGHMVKYVFITT